MVEGLNSISKEELEDLYLNQKMSIRQIAGLKKTTRGSIEHLLEKYCIPRRSLVEAAYTRSESLREEKIEDARNLLEDTIAKIPEKLRKIDQVDRNNLLVPIPLGKNRDCTLTFVFSDLHIGDANHLPDTFWSTVKNACRIIEHVKDFYSIKRLNVVLNGDMVAGRNVFKLQELRNLLSRGHWQVFLCEYIVKEVFQELEKSSGRKIDRIYLVRGTHENLEYNFILFLKRLLGSKARYLSHEGIVNIGEPIGSYNVFFTHGMSYSDMCPVPAKLQKDCLDAVRRYAEMNIRIDRICTSHTHWLSSSLIFNNVYWDVTGGFQRWEYTITNRPCGGILYLFNNNEVSPIVVRPDPKIEEQEIHEVSLEYKNLKYYGEYLLKHLKEIEEV